MPMWQSFLQEEALFLMSVKFFQGLSKKNLFFIVISLIYIMAIFLLSDSSVSSDLSRYNPYSLLHIPLYGILMFLLYLSFNPDTLRSSNEKKITVSLCFPIIISVTVAILDEIHQIYIPFREASIGDIFLDIIGIGLVAFLILTCKKKKIRFNPLYKSKIS